MSSPRSQDKPQDTGVVCPRCHAEMHPLFLYEDRDPDTWLCFACGHVEWFNPGPGHPIPPVDE